MWGYHHFRKPPYRYCFLMLLLLMLISGCCLWWSWHGHGDCGNLCDSRSSRHPTAFFLPETNCLEAPRKKRCLEDFSHVYLCCSVNLYFCTHIYQYLYIHIHVHGISKILVWEAFTKTHPTSFRVVPGEVESWPFGNGWFAWWHRVILDRWMCLNETTVVDGPPIGLKTPKL